MMGNRYPPSQSGTNGPIAYPAAGDVAPNLVKSEPEAIDGDTDQRGRASSESRRPSAGTTAVAGDPGTNTETGSNHSRSGQDHRGHGLEEDGLRLPPTVRTTTSASGKPYSSFSQGMKWMIVTLAGIAAVFSPISSNIFVPAIPTLSREFNRGEEQISLAVTVYLIFQAITPSFFGALSDSYGRRPVYISTLTLYLGANIGLALCPTSAFWLLLVLRAVQATGGSAVISIGSGTISDIAEPGERGMFMALFQGSSMVGPAFGPLLGGVFAETLGWRSIFWFLAIATGVILVPLTFFMPETLRSLVGDGSIPPPPLNMSPPMLWRHRRVKYQLAKTGGEREHVERPPKKKYQPLSSFKILLTKPEITLMFIFTSLLYAEFYCILTVLSTVLEDRYNLTELQIGLCYLPSGIGAILSSYLNGLQQDHYYRKEITRAGGDYRKVGEEFRLEWTRFRCLLPFAICFLVGATSLGWTLEARAPLAAVLVMGFFVGLGSGTNNNATIYGQDLTPGKGGAVSASLNLVRCLFGAVGTSVIQLLYASALGAGWTFVLLSGICVISFPFTILVVLKHGRGWREKRAEKRKGRTKE